MNVAETRVQMMGCVARLQAELTAETTADRREVLVKAARREVERLRKQFQRRIDEKASKRGRWSFAVNGLAGIEKNLAHCVDTALTAIQEVAAGRTLTLPQLAKGQQGRRRQRLP